MRKEPTVTSFLLVSFLLNEVLAYSHDPVQYHIQTDTGPDRYFRFQTYDGQYRKEKRFDDGTVVGTYGWVDPNGLLRLYDYIADTQGYRIARTRIKQVEIAQESGNEIPDTSQVLSKKRQRRPLPVSGNIRKVLPIHDPPATTAVASTTDETSNSRSSTMPILTDESSSFTKPKLRPLFVNRRKTQNNKDKFTRRRENYKSTRQQMKQQMEMEQQNSPDEAFGGNDEAAVKPTRRLTTRDRVPIAPAKNGIRSNPTFLPSESEAIPDIGYDNPGGRVSVDYDLGNQYRREKIFSDGTVIGEHGYVDPMGILRITYYKSGGSEGQQEFKKNYWVGTRLPGQTGRH